MLSDAEDISMNQGAADIWEYRKRRNIETAGKIQKTEEQKR